MFNEDSPNEKMIVEALKDVGWTYVSPDDLGRMHSDVMIESMVKSALICLNP